jgi:hypothetical protein
VSYFFGGRPLLHACHGRHALFYLLDTVTHTVRKDSTRAARKSWP